MANDWIIDVLADLKTYANKNGLDALSVQLDKASLIAATEIAASGEKALETTKLEVENWKSSQSVCRSRKRLKDYKAQQSGCVTITRYPMWFIIGSTV